MAKKELPQVQSCNRCGACCLVGGPCVVRTLAGLPQDFNGRCEILQDLPDGTTHCYLIAHALKDKGHLSLWAETKIDGNCDFSELRKEINATV